MLLAKLRYFNFASQFFGFSPLAEEESDTPDADASETSQGSFLNHLPPQRAFSEKRKEHAIEKRKESA